MNKKKRRTVMAACVLGVMAFLAVYFQWFSSLNALMQDMIYERPGNVNPDIKIIAIDEKTLDAIGAYDTWTREPYARLIGQLEQGDNAPKVIAFDVLFTGEKGDDDQLLVNACREVSDAGVSTIVMADNLVFSTQLDREAGTVRADTLHIDMVEHPFEELNELVQTGFANTVQDSRDSAIRYTFLEREDNISFSAAIVRALVGDAAYDELHDALFIDKNGGMLIDYTGAPDAYETLSMIDVLEGEIPAEAFKDSIVLVGAEAAGMGDSYPVPTGHGSNMYGVEINANIVQGILDGRSLTQLNRLYNAVIVGILILCLALLMGYLKLWADGIIAAAVIAAEAGLCLWLDGTGLMINMASLPVFVVVTFVWSIADRYVAEALQKRRIMHAFRKYVAPQVVEDISRNHDYRLRLGGEKRSIAVLFVDIRGFTPLSESLQPEQVVEILNEYLSLVTDAVFKNDGTLDKFIGDAAMAVFNAPFDCEDYIYKAVCAARDIAAGSRRIADTFMERYGKQVSYGIGVHCGEAVVGNIGSQFRMDYTAIGDTVNTAARLESNARPGQILISEAVYRALEGRIDADEIGKIPLKGKSQEIIVYSVTGTGEGET